MQWLATVTPAAPQTLTAGGSDASVRVYWRAHFANHSLIVMDADPQLFDSAPFLDIQQRLAQAGIRVPQVLAHDAALGLTLLEDLGDVLLASVLTDKASARAWYNRAIDLLVKIQSKLQPAGLPDFDAHFLRRELEIGREWYLGKHLGVELQGAALATWERSCALIIAHSVSQPRVFMLRDYHSRNLMLKDDELAVIDFQDAVNGPVSYDIVSLLRDAYLAWDETFVLDLAIRYWEKARKAGIPVDEDFGEFYRAFEWQGLQRHLKVLGLFARLHHRDGKDRYLADIPRVLEYIRKVCVRYAELTPLYRVFMDAAGEKIETGYTF
ncbi:aminoglycoside phosphotransferase family protein [Amantichitinum ursilacus]|uniref:Phosphotransferase enzyme family protein n=1 Tax=Amantichitinum ursilacus TaxID=857265 RepID=A0A0N0XIQ1_9NEIS|nr:phosphotransferase [Amantichitinum ursilacus]KPC50862.1 Phosphotransferase enzyme family protein [Amantichitinum ursilacus]